MAIADPDKSEIVRRQREAEIIARENEERLRREEAEKARIAADAERANIWNFLNQFVEDIKSGKRLNGNNRYTAGSCKAWSSFRKLFTIWAVQSTNTLYHSELWSATHTRMGCTTTTVLWAVFPSVK
ncbi:hypothetical protein [uncultured Duncaniella sp.]|uniref:hypothetical protein n=1 Tax=uncultured Duncaniella sp. TaxID=2768039 RepID=UPI0026E05362|nr:hypothetical protein [uncultured Duncaniella sp.]